MSIPLSLVLCLKALFCCCVVVVESHLDSLCNAIVHEIMGKPLVDSKVQN
jgi:hypothetical protein